ncbi:hypothetical protein JL720_16657 [Aureococcus anophagefferens]|nr:hypothetical protein JL720_16657 [Aureococcus anophagefferens]
MSPLPRRDTQTQVRSLKSELEDLLSAVALEGSSEGLPESFAGSVTDEGIFGSEGLEADRDLLARSALRAALDEEADSHARSRTRLDEREYDLEEAEARFGVDLATERAENLRLQTLVRKLGRAGAGEAVCDDYERRLLGMERRLRNYVKHTAGKMAIIRFLGEKEKNDKLDASWKLLSKELRNNTQVLVGTVNCGAVGKPICEYMGIESTTVAWGDPWNLQPYDGGASYDELYGLVRRRMTFCAVDETQAVLQQRAA